MENFIAPLLQGPGKLKKSLKSFTDEQLREALAQLIDGLERMSELGEGLEVAERTWRDSAYRASREQDWARYSKTNLAETPLQPIDESMKFRSVWSDKDNKEGEIATFDRESLEKGVRDAWGALQKHAQMFEVGMQTSQRLLAGEYIQSEAYKPEVEFEPTLKKRSPRP